MYMCDNIYDQFICHDMSVLKLNIYLGLSFFIIPSFSSLHVNIYYISIKMSLFNKSVSIKYIYFIYIFILLLFLFCIFIICICVCVR